MNAAEGIGGVGPDLTTAQIAETAAGAEELTRRGLAGDAAARTQYQRLLYELHEGTKGSLAVRAFIADRIYRIEDPILRQVTPGPARPAEEFTRAVLAQQSELARLTHPMSIHLFEGNPTREDLRVYMKHHWYRSRSFYRVIAELALTFGISDVALLYENLFEETGRAGASDPHPPMLGRLLEYLDLSASTTDMPTSPEALAYLNNRWRCARHEDPAWGLAILYAVESGTAKLHAKIHAMLVKLDVPERCREFHLLHSTLDSTHAADVLQLAGRIVRSARSQAAFFQSLQLHRQLSLAYFDQIWDEMRGEGAVR